MAQELDRLIYNLKKQERKMKSCVTIAVCIDTDGDYLYTEMFSTLDNPFHMGAAADRILHEMAKRINAELEKTPNDAYVKERLGVVLQAKKTLQFGHEDVSM